MFSGVVNCLLLINSSNFSLPIGSPDASSKRDINSLSESSFSRLLEIFQKNQIQKIVYFDFQIFLRMWQI